MAQEPRSLALRISFLAEARLLEIWRWNADRYGDVHADDYVKFRTDKTRDLLRLHSTGRWVPDRPTFQYMTLKKRTRGHGHVVVFQVFDAEVFVVDYFHTAQDWIKMIPHDLT